MVLRQHEQLRKGRRADRLHLEVVADVVEATVDDLLGRGADHGYQVIGQTLSVLDQAQELLCLLSKELRR